MLLGLEKISMERIKDEINKAFRYKPTVMLYYLNKFSLLAGVLEEKGLRFEVTNKK